MRPRDCGSVQPSGGTFKRIHLNSFINGDEKLEDYDILAVPGGFSFGDHLGSGRLMGNRMRFSLRDKLQDFVSAGKPIIGICNGFQVLVKTGLLPVQKIKPQILFKEQA